MHALQESFSEYKSLPYAMEYCADLLAFIVEVTADTSRSHIMRFGPNQVKIVLFECLAKIMVLMSLCLSFGRSNKLCSYRHMISI